MTERDSQPDPVGDLQRWLMRSGARGLSRDLTGQIRRALGQGSGRPADVWDSATADPPPGSGEAPECAWCPVCRAARLLRQQRQPGTGLGSYLSGAGETLASAVQEAYSAFEAAMQPHAHPREARPGDPWHEAADPREDTDRASDDRR